MNWMSQVFLRLKLEQYLPERFVNKSKMVRE